MRRTLVAILLAGAVLSSAPGCTHVQRHVADAPASEGLVMMFPGVVNVTSHLDRLERMVESEHPGWRVDLRAWGFPFLSFYNLRSYEQNLATARSRAKALAIYRRCHPDAFVAVVGYSGGGGMAVFAVESLPDDVQVDRLILLAPALAPDYPLAERVLPHVKDFAVCFSSRRDLQTGWGTSVFGTMERRKAYAAGFGGFNVEHPKLIQVHWSPEMVEYGHFGNHLSYVGPMWQRRYVLPALDPALSCSAVREVLLSSKSD